MYISGRVVYQDFWHGLLKVSVVYFLWLCFFQACLFCNLILNFVVHHGTMEKVFELIIFVIGGDFFYGLGIQEAEVQEDQNEFELGEWELGYDL